MMPPLLAHPWRNFMSIKDDLLIAVMRVLPKNGLSRAMGMLAELRLPSPVMKAVLQAYVRGFKVDLADVAEPLHSFTNVDEFFTRRLREGTRPFDADPNVVLSPCDGEVVSAGPLSGNQLVQAKGRRYSLARFLEDSDLVPELTGGMQVTIYLSPRDYHRVHSPVGGKITGYRYVPGHLFPVNRAAVTRVEELFAVNERLITLVDSPDYGKVAVGMVGAYGVGHISVSYDEIRTNKGGAEVVRRDFDSPRSIAAGGEVGAFHFGSTVVLIFPPGRVELAPLRAGDKVKMGETIGKKLVRSQRLRIIPG